MAPPSGPVDVTTSRSCRSTPRIRLHASRLAPQDVVRDEDGLPRTSIARTLLDLGDVLGPHRLERVCHEAELLRVLDANEMAELLARVPGRRTRALRAALATLADASPDVTRSELEERFLELIARARLPRPAVNARVAGFEVDFAWPAQRVIVETDGAAAHRTARAFERDRERDLALTVAGFRVIRLTWRRVTREPDHVAASLRALLAAAPTRPRPLPPPSPRAA